MKPIISLFWQICLLRQSPAYVPTFGSFVALVVLANIVSSTLVTVTFSADVALLEALTSIIVGQTTTAALALLALTLRNVGARFVTTITAIFGCDLLITACFALILPMATLLGPMALNLAFLGFLIWSVAVAGFIMHRALGVQLAVGVAVAVGMSLASMMFSQLAIGAS